ncbi:MAG: hypothetical protein M3P01_10605 [Actinomycetota bacterium]|nr:hypothetical protein [Actinomycetota bacterium]
MGEFNTQVIEMTPSVLLNFCRAFEEQYQIVSVDFYRRYLKGEYVGSHDALRWAAFWEAYLESAQTATPFKVHGDLRIAAE